MRTHVLRVILIVIHGRQSRDLDDFALGYERKLQAHFGTIASDFNTELSPTRGSHLPSYFFERTARPLDFCFHFGDDVTPPAELVGAEEVKDRVGRAGNPRVDLHRLPADLLDSTDGLDGEELFGAYAKCQAYSKR